MKYISAGTGIFNAAHVAVTFSTLASVSKPNVYQPGVMIFASFALSDMTSS